MINYNMRCIETLISRLPALQQQDKLQHEMYWNIICMMKILWKSIDKLQHEMYWNGESNMSIEKTFR